MKNTYRDLIEQTFYFPQEGFEVIDNQLHFNGIDLMEIIKQYGTPLKISYLPKIASQIKKAKRIFNVAIAKADYKGTYTYCYCTKRRLRGRRKLNSGSGLQLKKNRILNFILPASESGPMKSGSIT